MVRTSQRRASAPTPQMGLFQQPARPVAPFLKGTTTGAPESILSMARSVPTRPGMPIPPLNHLESLNFPRRMLAWSWEMLETGTCLSLTAACKFFSKWNRHRTRRAISAVAWTNSFGGQTNTGPCTKTLDGLSSGRRRFWAAFVGSLGAPIRLRRTVGTQPTGVAIRVGWVPGGEILRPMETISMRRPHPQRDRGPVEQAANRSCQTGTLSSRLRVWEMSPSGTSARFTEWCTNSGSPFRFDIS